MKQLTECIKGGSKDGKEGWLISFNYDPVTVEMLKCAVPHLSREWREQSKSWWVSSEYSNTIKGIFSNFEALAYLQGRLL